MLQIITQGCRNIQQKFVVFIDRRRYNLNTINGIFILSVLDQGSFSIRIVRIMVKKKYN